MILLLLRERQVMEDAISNSYDFFFKQNSFIWNNVVYVMHKFIEKNHSFL